MSESETPKTDGQLVRVYGHTGVVCAATPTCKHPTYVPSELAREMEAELASLRSVPQEAAPAERNIDVLVDRFLSWPLPESVCADGCATQRGYPHRTGTTLLTADEARQMLEYLLPSRPSTGWYRRLIAKAGDEPTVIGPVAQEAAPSDEAVRGLIARLNDCADKGERWNPSGNHELLREAARMLSQSPPAAGERTGDEAGRLRGAILALRQCKPLIAPKDWPDYAQQVLDLAAAPQGSQS